MLIGTEQNISSSLNLPVNFHATFMGLRLLSKHNDLPQYNDLNIFRLKTVRRYHFDFPSVVKYQLYG